MCVIICFMTMDSHKSAYPPDTLREYEQIFIDIADRANYESVDYFSPDLKTAIAATIRKPDYENSLRVGREVADEVINRWPTEFSSEDDVLRHAIGSGVHLAAVIDKLKVNLLGPAGSTIGSNALTSHATGWIAFATASELRRFSDDDVVSKVSSYFVLSKELVEQDIPVASWMALKAMRTAGHIFAAYNAQAEMLSHTSQTEINSKDTETLKTANDQLWQEMRATQTYGVKPAIAPSLNRGLVKDWLFASSFDSLQTNDRVERAHRGTTLAVVTGSNASFISSKVPMVTKVYENSNVKSHFSDLKGVIDTGDDTVRHFVVYIDREGQLIQNDGIPLSVISQEYGCEAEYEQIRSELLSIFFDLVTPVYVHEVVDQEIKDISKTAGSPDYNGKLRILALARTRTLKILGPDIADAINKEHETERQETIDRMLVKHDVIGHIRRLPTGFRASQEARNLCMQDIGIELADSGETYVRTHERGSVQEKRPKGHRASFEIGKTATRILDPNITKPIPRKKKHSKR